MFAFAAFFTITLLLIIAAAALFLLAYDKFAFLTLFISIVFILLTVNKFLDLTGCHI